MTRKKLRASADNSLLMAEILRERLEAVEPRAAFRHELYGRLVREAYLQRERHETNERRGAAAALRDFFLLRRGWTMACCLVLLTASGITTGYAYTSPDVTRESNLYFLKRAVEQAKMLAAATDEEEARAYIDLSARRVAEANVLAARGIIDRPTIEEMAANLNKAIDLTQSLQKSGNTDALTALLHNASRRQQQDLSTLIDKLETKDAVVIREDSVATPIAATPRGPRKDNVVVTGTIASLQQKIIDLKTVERAAGAQSDSLANAHVTEEAMLPDLQLALENFSDFPQGKRGTATLRIRNIGSSAAPAVSLTFGWEGKHTESLAIQPLQPGGDTRIPLEHMYDRTGTFSFVATVNLSRGVLEKSYGNNIVVVSVPVHATTKNECGPAGSRRCGASDMVEECDIGPNHVSLVWLAYEQCDGLCANGACTRACTDACAPGQKRCSGNDVQACEAGNGGCLQWRDTGTCGGNQTCNNGACVPKGPQCGNGQMESGEQCDDGNVIGNDGCDGACRLELPVSCTDSDGGRAYEKRGTAARTRGGAPLDSLTDSCVDNILNEYYCDANAIRTELLICPHGCRDGACLPQPLSCTDSDNGIAVATRGAVLWNNAMYADYCANDSSVFDYICGAAGAPPIATMATCAPGTVCREGACVPGASCGNGIKETGEQCDDGNRANADGCSSQCGVETGWTCDNTTTCTPICGDGTMVGKEECDDGNNRDGDGCSMYCKKSCTDTDAGRNAATRGTVSVLNASAADQCLDAATLREYLCLPDGNGFTSEHIACPGGCRDGACITASSSVGGSASSALVQPNEE